MVGRVGDVVHCAEQITERLTGHGCALRHIPFLALATLSLIPNNGHHIWLYPPPPPHVMLLPL